MQHEISAYVYEVSGQPGQMHRHVSGLLQHGRGHLNADEGHHKSPQQPPDYFGRPYVSLSHEQQVSTPNIQQPEASTRVVLQAGPSLSLSLEQPEHHTGMATVSGFHGFQVKQRVSEADHAPDVLSFDLERPVEQIEQSSHVHWSNSQFQSFECQYQQDAQKGMLLMERSQEHQQDGYRAASIVSSPLTEMVHNQKLQLVPASQFYLPQQRNQHIYPLPSVSHDAVVQDKQLFLDTLGNFLSTLGTRLTIPKIEGKYLDLHALYKEVTARGGLEQVIRYTRWKGVIEAMDILQSSPSASFVLRKHYVNLLYHYEQAYFFGIQGQPPPAPAPLPAPCRMPFSTENETPYEFPTDLELVSKKKKRKMNPSQILGVDPAASIGNIVTGAINMKFDEGYLVTVVVGGEKLTGVMYHVPSDMSVQQFASVPGLLNIVGSELHVPGLEVQLRGKKKESGYKKDPNAPRRTRTAYNIFYKEQRARLKLLHPEDKDVVRMVIEMWNKLPDEEKSLYIERAQQDKERYRQEMLDYEERLKLQSQIVEGSHGIGQSLTEQDFVAYDGSHDYHVTLDSETYMTSFPASQSQALESESQCAPMLSDQVYHMQEDGHAYIPTQAAESEGSGQLLESEQSFQMHGGLGENPEAPQTGGDDPLSEQAYPADEEEEDEVVGGDEDDETACCAQESGYPALDQAYQIQGGDNEYPSHMSEIQVHESEVQEERVALQQPYYVPKPRYSYPSHLPLPHVPQSEAPGTSDQIVYQMKENGQNFHSHLIEKQSEAPVSSVLDRHHYTGEGYAYTPARQMQIEPESLNVLPSSNQAPNVQEGSLSYSVLLQHQKQVLESAVHNRQISSELAGQGRYPYSVHLPYPQVYSLTQTHPYPVHFPGVHPYSFHLTPETQSLQYGNTIATQVQPQPHTPDVSVGCSAPSRLTSCTTDSGNPYHSQHDG